MAFGSHVNPTLARLEANAGISRDFVRAAGCSVWDSEGREYLDFGAGHGSFSLGHYDAGLVDGLISEVRKQPLQIHSIGPSRHMDELAESLTSRMGTPFEIAFFSNSGTEAVEGALKLARASTGRRKTIYCNGAYHGTTMGSLSLMAAGPLRDIFEPLLPDFVPVPFNDINSLQKALEAGDVAAFVVEPIPCEGGVLMPSATYLRDAIQACRDNGTLCIFDEIQTGLGRTGKLFAFEHWDARPDIVTIGKAFGGGLLPIGAYVTSRRIQDLAYGSFVTCASHHSTFGGNSLCCKVALLALERLSSQTLLARTNALGSALTDKLRRDVGKHPLIKDIRGSGLLVGLEFRAPNHPWLLWENMGLPEFKGLNSIPFLVMRDLLKNGIMTNVCAHNWNVLKIEPPLIIQAEHLDIFHSCLGMTLDKIMEKSG